MAQRDKKYYVHCFCSRKSLFDAILYILDVYVGILFGPFFGDRFVVIWGLFWDHLVVVLG